MIEVKLSHGWYRKLEPDNFHQWARNHGIGDDEWDFKSDFNNGPALYFKNEEDALLFKISFDV